MVDMATYRELHSKEEVQTAVAQDDLGEGVMSSSEPPDDPFVLLLPPRIRGFGLHDKKWSKQSIVLSFSAHLRCLMRGERDTACQIPPSHQLEQESLRAACP
jgi:hypothetical protein